MAAAATDRGRGGDDVMILMATMMSKSADKTRDLFLDTFDNFLAMRQR